MRDRPRITIVGAGNLGTALGTCLHRAGYVIDQIVFRESRASQRKAALLAKNVGARAVAIAQVKIEAEVVWLCVPDDAIAAVSRSLSRKTGTRRVGAKKAGARKAGWTGTVALHSSGALTSNELATLRQRGAHVASAHPMMTFVAGSHLSLAGVPFAIEGDAAAVRMSRRIVRELGGRPYSIRAHEKAAYHAWGTFASPLLTALLATSEQVAAVAGTTRRDAKARMLPMLQQTLANYAARDAAGSFSGPIVRGDVETIRRHLRVLRTVPAARQVYVALAKAATQYLPGKNKHSLRRLLAAAENSK